MKPTCLKVSAAKILKPMLTKRLVLAIFLTAISACLYGCSGQRVGLLQTEPTPLPSAMSLLPAVETVPAEPTADPLAAPKSALLQLHQAQEFSIEDDWSGLSSVGFLNAHYSFRRQGEAFTGQAAFSLGAPLKEFTATESVRIPESAALEFLAILAQSPVEPPKYQRGYGPEYEPNIDHTDDYPSISIRIELNNESIEYFTRSQGEDHVPWALAYKGNIYIINSPQPMQALRIVSPYLKKEKLTDLVNEFNTDIGMPDTGAQSP